MAAAAAGAVGSSVLLEMVVKHAREALVVLTNIAYPIGDMLLLALVVFVFAVTRWRPGHAWALMAAGLMLNAVGDAVYLYQTAVGTYVEGTWLDLVWPLSVVLLAFAAWQRPGRAPRPARASRAARHARRLRPDRDGRACRREREQCIRSPCVLAAATIVLVLARTALTFRENARLLETSRHEALTDSLTGLGNRRKLLNDLEAEIEAARDDEARVLVIFDLNGFKTYNDTFGHPAGDALLARLGAKLAAAVEPDGAAYRMGGDEFCVLLPDAGSRHPRDRPGAVGERRGLRRLERVRAR